MSEAERERDAMKHLHTVDCVGELIVTRSLLTAAEQRGRALAQAIRDLLDAAEFGSMEQSPPGYWDAQIAAAKALLADT